MQKTGDLTDLKRGSQDTIKQKLLECVNESDVLNIYKIEYSQLSKYS